MTKQEIKKQAAKEYAELHIKGINFESRVKMLIRKFKTLTLDNWIKISNDHADKLLAK